MPVSAATLIQRTRRFVRDWPDQDVLTASVSDVGTTLTVADGTLFPKNWQLEIDSEVLTVSTTGTGTSVPVRRGARGTTAATHANASVILIRPNFFQTEILDAINAALQECYPLIYQAVSSEYDGILADTYEYNIPNMPGTYGGDSIPVPFLSKLEMKFPGQTQYGEIRNYEILRGASPFFKLRFTPDAGTLLRLTGYGPFPDLAIGDSLNAQFPRTAIEALVVGASSFLLMSGEAGRVRVDTLATDDREQANRSGSSMSASAALYQRFRQMLNQAALPPLNRHAKPTF